MGTPTRRLTRTIVVKAVPEKYPLSSRSQGTFEHLAPDGKGRGSQAKSISAKLTPGRSAKLTLRRHHKNDSQNPEDGSPYQKPPRMRRNYSADGPCQRQTPNPAPDSKNTTNYSYQAEYNPNRAAPNADKLAQAIPHNERPADDAQYSSGGWLPCLHGLSTSKISVARCVPGAPRTTEDHTQDHRRHRPCPPRGEPARHLDHAPQ